MLPEKFVLRMKDVLGDSFDAFLRSYDAPPERAVRVNLKKISPERFLASFPYKCEKIPYAQNGFYVSAEAEEKIGLHPLHHAGAFYVQEPSAMAPVCAVDIKPDFKVLDMCAAPGGKSSQIAEAITGGVLVSNEISQSRAAVLMGNIERQGFENVVVTNTDPKTLAKWYRGVFDLTLCDAPCSGEGMFRKNPDAALEWSEENVKSSALRQKEILASAAVTVKGGGYLLYSTCTFSPDEDEGVINDFLRSHADFSLVKVGGATESATVGGIDMPLARRFYPHLSRGEGQFFALMQKSGGEPTEISYGDGARALTQAEERTVREFLADVFDEIPRGRIAAVGKTVCFVPDFPVPPHSVFSAGVKIGEIDKGRVVPHHQLFSALGAKMKRRVELGGDEASIKKYVGGDVITADVSNGWCAVTYLGCAVGGAKAVDQTLKNHYPKGLRRKI